MLRKTRLPITFFAAILAFSLPAGDLLDQLSRSLDNLEGCFWQGYFAKSEYVVRKNTVDLTEKVSLLARAVQAKRLRRHQTEIANPTVPAAALVEIMRANHSMGNTTRNPSVRRTDWGSFLDDFEREHRVLKNQPPVIPTREQYTRWLQKVSEENARKISRFRNGQKKWSQSMKLVLDNDSQRYVNAVMELRLSIYDLRRNDPAFILTDKPKRIMDTLPESTVKTPPPRSVTGEKRGVQSMHFEIKQD